MEIIYRVPILHLEGHMSRSSRSGGIAVTLAMLGALAAGCSGAEPSAAQPGPSPAASADPAPMDELRAGFTKLAAGPYQVASNLGGLDPRLVAVQTEWDEARTRARVIIYDPQDQVTAAEYVRIDTQLYGRFNKQMKGIPRGVGGDRWYRLNRDLFKGDPTELWALTDGFSRYADALISVERPKYYAFTGTIDLIKVGAAPWLLQRFPDGGAAVRFEANTDPKGHVRLLRYTVPAGSGSPEYVQEVYFHPWVSINPLQIDAPSGQVTDAPNAMHDFRVGVS